MTDKKIVFFTGAGISAESNIPTFRDYRGKAHEENFEKLLSLSYFVKHPEKTWEWLDGFIQLIGKSEPNEAHKLIASMNASVITQNIDNFHTLAGSEDVVELHGSIGTCICMKCHKRQGLISKCSCGSWTKPDFTFYEENLNEEAIYKAEKLAKEADIFVIVGTSGIVYPAANIPAIAKQAGAKVYEINPGMNAFPPTIVDRYIKKGASEGIKLLIDLLKE
jgi:NAD-dependent deacetylase